MDASTYLELVNRNSGWMGGDGLNGVVLFMMEQKTNSAYLGHNVRMKEDWSENGD